MTHKYAETLEDRDGRPCPATCAYCGHLWESCVGEGGGGHPDYAQIGEAIVSWLIGDDDHARRTATAAHVLGRLQREAAERRSLEASKALSVGRKVLALAALMQDEL